MGSLEVPRAASKLSGGLSWRQQPGTPVYGKNYDAEKTRIALAEASPERLAEFRAS
jgi:hypothetical protein